MSESGKNSACGNHHTPRHISPSHMCGQGGHSSATSKDACHCRTQRAPTVENEIPAAIPQNEPQAKHLCTCRPLSLPRRIHAAGGLLFGLFLAIHLTINSTAISEARFSRNVGMVHAILDWLPGLTLVTIFLPLLSQICSGIFLLTKEGIRYDSGGCNRGSTMRFFLQRLTALTVIAFIVLHLGTLHGWCLSTIPRSAAGGLAGYAPSRIFFNGGQIAGIPFLIGLWGAVYHLANGAISGANVWHLFSTDIAKRRWRLCSLTLGIALAVTGTVAWFAFMQKVITELP
jgi:succinate dehydrogenase / fumarate reductase, cytochrome b subunit